MGFRNFTFKKNMTLQRVLYSFLLRYIATEGQNVNY